jgi:Terminase small subunit
VASSTPPPHHCPRPAISFNPVEFAKKSLVDKEPGEQIQLRRISRGAKQMPKKLTNRQRRFALADAADPQHNGTKAAFAAGCPKTSAHVMASRWLKNADVQDHVEQFLGRVAQKYELSAEKVIQELSKLAFANMADYVEINRGRRVLESVRNNARPGGRYP